MNVEEIREYCLTKKGAAESFPFDETTLVFKVFKIFCLLSLDSQRVSLKNDPEKNIELRAHYPETIYGGSFSSFQISSSRLSAGSNPISNSTPPP